MAFLIEISPSALHDAEGALLWMQKQLPNFADDWFNELLKAIYSLDI